MKVATVPVGRTARSAPDRQIRLFSVTFEGVPMALRAANSDQAVATDRGVDIHVCSVDIRVDVRPGRVFNGA